MTRKVNRTFIKSANSGFTLLEIAIAVTLLAMMMTLAAVQVRGYHARQQLEYAAHQVELRFEGLRQKSIREEKTCMVRVDWENSRLVWSTLTPDQTLDPDSEQWTDFQTLYELDAPVEFVKPAREKTKTDDAVYFYQDGRSTQALYHLQHSRTKESLWISLTDWSGVAAILDRP